MLKNSALHDLHVVLQFCNSSGRATLLTVQPYLQHNPTYSTTLLTAQPYLQYNPTYSTTLLTAQP
jgi:hypothetical protein